MELSGGVPLRRFIFLINILGDVQNSRELYISYDEQANKNQFYKKEKYLFVSGVTPQIHTNKMATNSFLAKDVDLWELACAPCLPFHGALFCSQKRDKAAWQL